jgi:hypothetical protein
MQTSPGNESSPEAKEQAGDIAPMVPGDKSDGSDGSNGSNDGSIISVLESIFSKAPSTSSATSTGQFPPQAKEQAEHAIAAVLAKNTEVSTIVVRGVDKLGEQGVDRLMARSLRQFSSATKLSLDREQLKECFSFLQLRAVSIAWKIRKIVQSNNHEAPETSALRAFLEKNDLGRVTPGPDIRQWIGQSSGTSAGAQAYCEPEFIDQRGASSDRNTKQPPDLEPNAPDEPMAESDASDEDIPLGERLIEEISRYLASDEVSRCFVSAVKENFIKVRQSRLAHVGKGADSHPTGTQKRPRNPRSNTHRAPGRKDRGQGQL